MPLLGADILAGPIVRRVERGLVSVWVALTKPAAVRLEIFRGLGSRSDLGAAIPALDPARDPTDTHTIAVGARLHIAVAIWEPAPPASLDFGNIYSYDVRIQPDEGGDETGLGELGLLADTTISAYGTDHLHLALGYHAGWLPSFATPALHLADLKLVQGSCRETDAKGRDAFPEVDELIRANLEDAKRRPQMLFLTGDQIYADAVCVEQLEVLHKLAAELFGAGGKTAETIDVEFPKARDEPSETIAFPMDGEHFPAGRRANLANDLGRFTVTDMTHAMGFGEYVSLYLTGWSNIGWSWNPAALLAARKQRFIEYKAACEKLYESFGRHKFPEHEEEAVRERIPYHPAWLLVPPEYRAIDRYLSQDDRDAAWGKGDPQDGKEFDLWQRFWLEPELKATPADPALPPVAPSSDPKWRQKNRLARALTPSWYAGKETLGMELDPKFNDDDTFKELIVRRDNVRRRIHRMHWFYEGLPRVRRMLANIASYMTFDDHEVTDDWNITPRWVKQTRGNALGRAVTRNGLAAYAIFQGWGNDPGAYRKDTLGRKVLEQISKMFSSATPAAPGPDADAARELEVHFDLRPNTPTDKRMLWHYRYDGSGFEVLALDSRTWRGLEPEANPSIGSRFSDEATATILTDEALRMQIPEQPAVGVNPDGVSIVLAAAPILGFPPVESMVQPVLNLVDMVKTKAKPPFARWKQSFLVGRVKNDPEPWGFVPALFEAVLERLSTRRRVLILSGDVHYSFAAKMAYWKLNPDQSPRSITRFAQLTSSSFRKEREVEPAIFTVDFLQQIAGLVSQLERYGWRGPAEAFPRDLPPLEPGTSPFSPRLQQALVEEPILVSPQGVPADAHYRLAPEWAWRMELAIDERPDTVRLESLHPPPFSSSTQLTEILPSIAQRHLWQTQNGLPRRWHWWTNFTMVEFGADAEGRANRVRHSVHSFDFQGIEGRMKPFFIAEIPLDVTEPTPVVTVEPVS